MLGEKMNWIVEACKREESELIYLRRELHKIPEIGNSLPRTAAFVMQTLEKWNIPYKSNTGDDGVVVEIASEKEGKTALSVFDERKHKNSKRV